ncbi:MAG: hypothetical protein HC912_08670 [Saprospiraceae bacterium]|nr:hypothetical protein [Saprospiraceae bacterium]
MLLLFVGMQVLAQAQTQQDSTRIAIDSIRNTSAIDLNIKALEEKKRKVDA